MKTPTELWQEIATTTVAPGTACLWWLYQAGIAVKSPGGTVILIDPYLSDAVIRSYGTARNVPAPLDPAEVDADAVLASHGHEDHLDPDSIQPFLGHERTRFIGPPIAADKVLAKGIGQEKVVAAHRGDVVEVGDVSVRVVAARHIFPPEPAPDAVGYVLQIGPVSLHHSGDTEYDREIWADTQGVTASLICMNGTGGNMVAQEAALLAFLNRARVAIPFHYGLWADAGYGEGATLDPQLFVSTYHRLNPDGVSHLLEPGRPVVFDAEGIVSAG